MLEHKYQFTNLPNTNSLFLSNVKNKHKLIEKMKGKLSSELLTELSCYQEQLK